MKNLKLGTLAVLAACIATFGTAMAQSVHHDKMDARSARADIRRLKVIRAEAVRTHNYGKIAQTDRLIDADRHFVRKDKRKVARAGG